MEGKRKMLVFYMNKNKNTKLIFLMATCFVMIWFIYRLHKAEPETPSSLALPLQADHTNIGTPQLDETNLSNFGSYLETLKNNYLNPKEVQGVKQRQNETGVERKEDRKRMVDKMVNLIKSITNLTDTGIIDLLTQTLNSMTSDLRALYQKLQRFQEEETCPACLAKRKLPITVVGTEARIQYDQYWEGLRLPVIYSDLTNGRLGNQMAAYATMLAISEIFNASVFTSNKAIAELRKTFPRLSLPSMETVTKADLSDGDYTDTERDDAAGAAAGTEDGSGDTAAEGSADGVMLWTTLEEDVSFTPSYISLQLAALGLLGPHYFTLCCYPFEFQLFHAIQDKVQSEFCFSDDVLEKAKKYLEAVASAVHTAAKQTPPVFVAVHVRLGDYTQHMNKVSGVQTLNYTNYLKRATHFFESLYDNVVFVVASDDVTGAMQHFQGKPNVFFPAVSGFDIDLSEVNSASSETRSRTPPQLTPRSPAEDMSLLAQCHHSIITLGTFGFFSAYLGSGTVLYPDIVTKIPNPHTRTFYERAKLDRFIPIPM